MSMPRAIILILGATFYVPVGHCRSYSSHGTNGTRRTCSTLSVARLPGLGPGQGSSRLAGSRALGMRTSERAATNEQLMALLGEANAAFQQANAATDPERAEPLYEKAILLYEKIIADGGIHNAKLYFNLANAYLLTEDLGRAILNYRRAETLARGQAVLRGGWDLNLRKNLAFARSRRIDRVEIGAEKRVLETLFFWHYDFSLATRFLLACLAFATLSLALTAMLWLGRGPATLATAVVAGVLLTAFVVSITVEANYRARTCFGVITAPEVVARQGDGPNYPASFKDPLHAGTEFELIEQRPGWLQIELADGSDAWIPDTTAERV